MLILSGKIQLLTHTNTADQPSSRSMEMQLYSGVSVSGLLSNHTMQNEESMREACSMQSQALLSRHCLDGSASDNTCSLVALARTT